jgi:acetate kinase
MPELVLALNAGTTGLRFGLFERGDPPRPIERGLASFGDAELTWSRADGSQQTTRLSPTAVAPGPTAGVSALIGLLGVEVAASGRLVAIAHRFAEDADGGTMSARLLDEGTWTALNERSRQSPWQLPAALALAKAASTRWPKLPHVACFDTSFHSTWSEHAVRLSLPVEWRDRGMRRRGGHGLSIAHAVGVIQLELPAAHRLVVAHLGATSSVCAVRDGRALDSTLGYSVLDGLPMQTRAGDLEPGVLVHLARHAGFDGFKLEELVARRGGLAALSGLSGDFRELLVADSDEARFAIAHFAQRVAEAVARMGTVLGGIDAIAFTGGIGAGSFELRAAVIDRLGWIGATLNPAANARNLLRIHDERSRLAVFAIPTDEERQLAIEALRAIEVG